MATQKESISQDTKPATQSTPLETIINDFLGYFNAEETRQMTDELLLLAMSSHMMNDVEPERRTDHVFFLQRINALVDQLEHLSGGKVIVAN